MCRVLWKRFPHSSTEHSSKTVLYYNQWELGLPDWKNIYLFQFIHIQHREANNEAITTWNSIFLKNLIFLHWKARANWGCCNVVDSITSRHWGRVPLPALQLFVQPRPYYDLWVKLKTQNNKIILTLTLGHSSRLSIPQ